MSTVARSALILLASGIVSLLPAQEPSRRTFDLRDFRGNAGATGDDTGAFCSALRAVARAGGGRLIVPRGDYLTGPLTLCSGLELDLEKGACLRFSSDPARYRNANGTMQPLMRAEGCHDVIVSGSGVLDGQGQPWWAGAWKVIREARAVGKSEPSNSRPRLLFLDRCQRVRIEGVTLENSPQITVAMVRCEDVLIRGAAFVAPATFPNTAGITTTASSRIAIERCRFDVGDDCIAFNGGAGPEGPCHDLTVADCLFLHGHGCSIGSDTRGGIERVIVHDCRFVGTQMGIRLKSARGRGGLAEDLTYERLDMQGVGHAVVISSYYPRVGPDEGKNREPGSDGASPPRWRGIRIANVTAHGCTGSAGSVFGLPDAPVKDLTFENVVIDAPTGLRIGWAQAVRTRNLQISAAKGPALMLDRTAALLP